MVLLIDVVDVCNLKCPTCVRGTRLMPNSPRKMPLDQFRRIATKAKKEGFTSIDFINWTEPFLVTDLEEYIAIANELGMSSSLSTNLSLKKINNLEKVLQRTKMLTVSVSGLDQEVYEINHVGGDVAYILEHLNRISELKAAGRIQTHVVLRLIKFDYNANQEEKLRALAERLGLAFEAIVGSGHPLKWPLTFVEEDLRRRLTSYGAERPHEKPGEICPMLFQHVCVDSDGDVFECCVVGNFEVMKIGRYLDLTPEEILLRRYQHPICNSCSWPRRPVTEEEKQKLAQAVVHRLGMPAGSQR